MSLLAPLFLLGAAAIALPFWLHRLQTQSADRQPFSSAMLLEAAEQRVHVRKRLKYLLLLSMRVLLLLLLALVFAKPVLTRAPAALLPGVDGTELVLVDTSASMGQPGLFASAIELAQEAVDDAPAGAAVQVLSADAGLHIASGLTRDRNEISAALRGLAPTALRLDFGRAMAGLDRLAEDLPAPVTLHIVSDFQESGMPARFAELVSPRVASLVTHVAGPPERDNWSVDVIRATPDGIEAGILGPPGVEQRLSAELIANGAQVGRQSASITGSGSVHFDPPPLEEGDNRVSVSIDVDDALALDNRRYLVVEQVPPAPVPILTLDQGGLPVTYLTAALESDPGRPYKVEPWIIGDFDPRSLSRYAWAIVDDVGSIDTELGDALLLYVQNGGSLLMFAGLRSAALTSVPVLGSEVPAASTRGSTDEFLSVGQVNSDHPVLARTEGWYSVNVGQSLPVRPQAADEVLIRLENGDAFLIERRVGDGRVLLLASGLENEWNDLPLRPVFVSFMGESARYLSGADEVSKSQVAGAILPLAQAGTSSGQVVDPEGKSVLTLADTTRAQQVALDIPGFYEVYTPETDYIVAVNPDRRESDLSRADTAVLARWRESMDGGTTPTGAAPAAITPSRVELWHSLLLVLALVVIGEAVLGNYYLSSRTHRRVEAP